MNTRDLIGEQATLSSLVSHTLTSFEDDKVETLRPYAFYNQSQLKEISLPNVITLGDNAFNGCTGAIRFKIALDQPNVITGNTNAFSGTGARSVIYVPDELVNSYKSNSGWSSLSSRIHGISEMPEPEWDETEITDSWAEIASKVESGTADYKLGNYKNLDCGSEGTVKCYVIGKNVDELADESGMAAFTFGTYVGLNTTNVMNPANNGNTEGTGTIGGWGKCEMRTYLNNTILTLLPTEAQAAIKSVKKYSGIYNTSGALIKDDVTSDKLWVFSYKEVGFGTACETNGVIYSSYFVDRIRKNQSGSLVQWYLRSPRSTDKFHQVGTDGNISTYYSFTTPSTLFGFCI